MILFDIGQWQILNYFNILEVNLIVISWATFLVPSHYVRYSFSYTQQSDWTEHLLLISWIGQEKSCAQFICLRKVNWKRNQYFNWNLWLPRLRERHFNSFLSCLLPSPSLFLQWKNEKKNPLHIWTFQIRQPNFQEPWLIAEIVEKTNFDLFRMCATHCHIMASIRFD